MRIKKNIIFLVLTLLIFIPYASAECDFSIPGRIVCHEERTQPYNTSKPTIIAKFYEFPVEREEFRLTSWETNAIKPLDIILEEPTYLSYVSTNHLPDGKFEFYLRARDIDSNIVEMHVNFTVNASHMWVYVLNPENKHIIKPKFAVGDNTTFPLELKLQRPGKCRYNIYPIQGDINQQTYNILPMEFQQSASDPTINYDNAFNMSGVITGYQYNGDLATLYMICKEDGDSRFNYVEIEVGADL